MRRLILWIASTAVIVALLFGYRTSTAGAGLTQVASSETPITASAPVTAGGSDPATSPRSAIPSSTTGTTTKAAGSTFDGTTVMTRYGPVQVRVTTNGSSITGVSVVQYPNGDGRSQQISSYALPQLIQETLQAQSAHVDMVSGATYTSTGYEQSMQAALDQAGV